MEYNPPQIDDKDIAALLGWYIAAGVDETMASEGIDRFSRPDHLTDPPAEKISGSPSRPAHRTSAAHVLLPVEEIARKAQTQAESCKDLAELREMISNFDGCLLKRTATNTVFSDGNPDSDIMLVGDLPGAREDREGTAFAGEAGELLDRMFAAIGLERKRDFYVTNLLPWRPPGNRQPTTEEITVCMPFIKRHIELFNPKLIILLGGLPANNLLGSADGIARLRGRWKEYDLKGRKIPARALFHPAYLLKQPRAKGNAWQDLLEIKAKIGGLS